MKETETVKVVFIGESGVGKLELIKFYIYGDNIEQEEITAQKVSKTIDFPDYGKSIKFDIWDTPSLEKFRPMVKIIYKDAKVIVLIYDITKYNSFESLKTYWLDSIKSDNPNAILAVVANNSHLYEYQQVSNEEGKEFAKSIGAIFQTTSIRSRSGIDYLFEKIGKKYLDPSFDIEEDDNKEKELYLNLQRKKEKMEKEKKNGKNEKNIEMKNENSKKTKEKCLII